MEHMKEAFDIFNRFKAESAMLDQIEYMSLLGMLVDLCGTRYGEAPEQVARDLLEAVVEVNALCGRMEDDNVRLF